MPLYPTERDYLFHLITTSPQEAKHLWKRSIKKINGVNVLTGDQKKSHNRSYNTSSERWE